MYEEKRGSWNPGEYFTMVGHGYLELVASNPDTPTDMKLWALVMARMNSIGHAEFKAGELARALGSVDSDGVVKPMSPRGVRLAIERLVTAGAIQGGNSRCIQVSTYGMKREGQGSGDSCYFCGINTDKRRVRRKKPGEEVPISRMREIRKEVEASKVDEKASEPVPSTEPLPEPEEAPTAVAEPVVDPWDIPVPKALPRKPPEPKPEPEQEPESEPNGFETLRRKYRATATSADSSGPAYESGWSMFDVGPKARVSTSYELEDA